MKNILIISQFFSPCNSIAAIRFTKVVKYLARTGNYHFFVVTYAMNDGELVDHLLEQDIESVKEFITVLRVPSGKKGNSAVLSSGTIVERNKKPFHKRMFQKLSSSKSGCMKLLRIPFEIHDILEEAQFAIRGLRALNKRKDITFDTVVSTYGHVGAHLLALLYVRKHGNCKLVADYRDPVSCNTMLMGKFVNDIVRKIDCAAEYITGASDDCIGSGVYHEKFRLILNGFDPEDIKGFTEYGKSEKFTIGYTGRLYSGQSDMSLLFRAVSELLEEKRMEASEVCISYAGREIAVLLQQANQYNLSSIIDYRGMISREDALRMQSNADILCLLTWISPGNTSILTGKFYEYLLMQKPIVAIVSGNMTGSKTKQLIEELQVGICVEEANQEEDYCLMKEWLDGQYQKWKSGEKTDIHSDSVKIMQYSSMAMAEKFEKLL